MPTSLVQAIVRRSNRRLLIGCSLGVLVLVGLAAFNIRYLYNFVLGPTKISTQELLAISDPDAIPRYWVTVEGDNVVDTGYQRVSENDSGDRSVIGYYMALLVDQRLLLVKAPKDDLITSYTGTLEVPSSSVQSNVIDDLTREYPDAGDALLPFMLNTDDLRSGGYVALGVGAIAFALLAFGIGRALKRMSDPASHPIFRGLSRFGLPIDVAGQIESEMILDHPSLDQVHITPNWLVQATSTNFAATRLNDVIWGYKQVTQHRTNGIPTGKTYAAHIWDRHGVCLTFAGREHFVDQVLATALQHVPWMLAGFSPELEKSWKSDRNAVLAAADQRRQQMMSQE